MYKKPKKRFVYDKDIQRKIYSVSKKVVVDDINEYNRIHPKGRIIKANIFGTISRGEMGVYVRKYANKRYGSDIDVVCLVEEKFKAPKSWHFMNNWGGFDEYMVDTVERHLPELGERKDLPLHPIKFLIFVPGKHDIKLAKQYSGIDERHSRRNGWPVHTWYVDKPALRRYNR